MRSRVLTVVLLLAVGIKFGTHTINRYREKRLTEDDPERAMRTATDQLLVAFFIVTATTVLGFSSNLVSGLLSIREFGLVATVGIAFTFLVFGVFLPSLKLYTDALRERYPIPTFSQTPIGSEGSRLGGVFALPVFPAVGDFGLLTALSVIYAFLSSLLVLPTALVVWECVFGETGPHESRSTNS